MSDNYLSSPLSFGSALGGSSTTTEKQQQTNQKNLTTSLSPYLNYEPRLFQSSQPEFIFPEGAAKQRGRFELAFSQIGSSVMIGAGIGGSVGFYNGLRLTSLAKETGKLRRTQMLNHVMKQGSATANTFGTIAVMYSGFGVLLQYLRGEDDDINTVLAGSATGMLYKSTAGLKKCAIGGGMGFGVAASYCLYNYLTSGGNQGNNLNFGKSYM